MKAFPLGDLDAILGGRTPLVLAPHPDDESLGCGGLLAACAAAGRGAFVVVLTDGTGSHPNSRAWPPERLRALREAEATAAIAALGMAKDRIGFLRLRDTAAPMAGPAFAAAVAAIAAVRVAQGCDALLAPWRHDPHCDHAAAHRMAAAVARQSGVPHLAYPVWGWTLPDAMPLAGPVPSGWRLDIGPHLAAKRRAIAAHASQATDLIGDDAAGFRLPADLLARLCGRTETFLTAP